MFAVDGDLDNARLVLHALGDKTNEEDLLDPIQMARSSIEASGTTLAVDHEQRIQGARTRGSRQ